MKRDRYPYALDAEVRAALERAHEESGVPIQTIIDRAVRKALGLAPRSAKGAVKTKKRAGR